MLNDWLLQKLPAHSLRRRFVEGAFWSIVATFLAQGFAFLATVFIARFLGKAEFGELGMIRDTVGTFGVLAGLGIAITATKHVAEFRTVDVERTSRVLRLCTIVTFVSSGAICLIVYILAPILCKRLLNAPHLIQELRIACGLLFFNALIEVKNGALSGFESFRHIATIGLFRGLVIFIGTIGGVLLWGLTGAIIGLVIASFFSWFISRIVLRRVMYKAGVPLRPTGLRKELNVLWDFSFPAFLSGAMVNPVRWFANAMLVARVGGYAELGLFTATAQFQNILNLIGSRIGIALLPILSSPDGAKSERLGRANMLLSWMIGVGAALPLLCIPELFGIIFGGQFTGLSSRRTFILMLCFTCIIMYKHGLSRVIVTESLMWWGVLSNTMWAVTLLSSFWFLRRFGAQGMAGAYLMAYALNTICFIPLYNKKNLVPSGTLVSVEAGSIWAVIGIQSLLAWFDMSFYIRIAFFCVSCLILFRSFYRLLHVPKSDLLSSEIRSDQ